MMSTGAFPFRHSRTWLGSVGWSIQRSSEAAETSRPFPAVRVLSAQSVVLVQCLAAIAEIHEKVRVVQTENI